ncbi:hypothetical protein DK871_18225 [Pseudomonas sp. L13]|nr:hypothetical protein [Pseudomonas sp. L13]
MLAKGVNDNAGLQNERGACAFFASKLAPALRLGPPSHLKNVSGAWPPPAITLPQHLGVWQSPWLPQTANPTTD